MTLGRSNVHDDASWQGGLITKVRFHVTNWGNGSNLIDVDMAENTLPPVRINNFIGGWMDATNLNGSYQMIMWLRGGTTTYFYHSNYPVNPVVHDGVLHDGIQDPPVSYQLDNTPGTAGAITSKTAPDPYVNINGTNFSRNLQTAGTLSAIGTGNNYLASPLCIGVQTNYGYQLAVNGNAIFNKVVVKPYPNWSDYVFDSAYVLRPLDKVEQYIKDNHHLPEIPSADSVARAGIDVGANQAALLKKIEELTLYTIEQDKVLRETRKQLEKERAQIKVEREQMKDMLDGQRRLQQAQQARIDRIEHLLAEKLK